MSKYFSASLDTVSKIITGLVTPLFTIFPLILFFALRTQQDASYVPYFIGVTICLWLIFAYCLLFWITGYSIEDGNLVIHRKWKDKMIPLTDIISSKAVSKTDMGFVIRYMGNGGLFGYTGFFSNKEFGRMQYFVTNCDNVIVLQLAGSKIICISPDDVAGFIKVLKK